MNSDEIDRFDVKFEHIMLSANKIINLKASLESAKSEAEKKSKQRLISEYTKYIEANTTSSIDYVLRYAEQINDVKANIKKEGNIEKKYKLKDLLKMLEDNVKSHIASADQHKSQSDKASQFRNNQKANFELFEMLDERQAKVRAEARKGKNSARIIDISKNNPDRADSGR